MAAVWTASAGAQSWWLLRHERPPYLLGSDFAWGLKPDRYRDKDTTISKPIGLLRSHVFQTQINHFTCRLLSWEHCILMSEAPSSQDCGTIPTRWTMRNQSPLLIVHTPNVIQLLATKSRTFQNPRPEKRDRIQTSGHVLEQCSPSLESLIFITSSSFLAFS